jgi:Ni/Co efflux regulator RcnB
MSFNKKAAVSALMVVSLLTAEFAFAQGNRDNNRNNRDHQKQEQRDNQRDNQRQDPRDNQRRDERGAGPNHDFRRGGRLPTEYRSRQYVVEDWRSHRLSAPPRGYHWVQTGGDYVLVAIATGVILQLLLNN